MKKKKDLYESEACDFLNEAECEETLDEEGVDVAEAQKAHFEEDTDSFE